MNSNKIQSFTLRNKNGLKAQFINYGARLTHLWIPDKEGNSKDIVLGYDNDEDYLTKNEYFGATIGRFANRIKNGSFTINGTNFQVAKNNGENHLHGGLEGFQRKFWEAEKMEEKNSNTVKFTLLSPDNEENYPGNLNLQLSYTLTEQNELIIRYKATTDAPTILNLTHHSFFNLAGNNCGDLKTHQLKIFADYFTPIDDQNVPTGEMTKVAHTVFDFRQSKDIISGMESTEQQIIYGNGYDHNWVLKPQGSEMLVAELLETTSGRKMQVFTNQPGMQVYTTNWVDDTFLGKAGYKYPRRSAICLETQHFPDSPNIKHFASPILNPDETYDYFCTYKFL